MFEDSSLTAKDVMTRDVVTVQPATSVRYAAKLMAEHRISGVPVVDEEGRMVGMLSEADLIRWKEGGEKQAWWLNMLAEGFDLAPDYLEVVRSEKEKTRMVMKEEVISVSENTSLIDVAKIMADKQIKRVPVLDRGKIVGLVSRADLIRAFADGH